MVSVFITFAAVFTSIIGVLAVASVVPVVLGIEGPLGFLALFWGLTIVLSVGLAKLSALFAQYDTARAIVRAGTAAAIVVLSSGFMIVSAEILGLSPWFALPFAVAFGVLLMVWDEEIRRMLSSRARVSGPPASHPRQSALPADRRPLSLRR